MLTHDVVIHIKQDVIKARIHKFEQLKMLSECETTELENGSRQDRRQDGRSARKRVQTRNIREISHDELLESVQIKKRVCVKWIPDIHARFVKACEELGEESVNSFMIYPLTSIKFQLQGLSRLQVASHLQKYQKDLRKSHQGGGTTSSSSNKKLSSNLSERVDLRTVGNVSGVATHVENHDQIVTNIDGTLPSNGGQSDVNNQSIMDLSLMNGSGLEILEEVHSIPTDSNQNSLHGIDISDDFFDCVNGINGETPYLGSMELNEWEPNYIDITEQLMLPDYYYQTSINTSNHKEAKD
ncbi:hypothetical protein L1987_46801 [Smallanthus sonchifolius]|uniref:Uncharacterized protein n=1 Tax=Smallanthus sonchifolius TaxID=185202 RepID=A0ACB9G0M8_9ASTR|nr:hypothetical protein L1987_46801 [Smallanthus sonchifolius]